MAATRNAAIRTLTIAGQQVTAIEMHQAELASLTEDIDTLGLPQDTHHLAPLRGWNIYDADGTHFGRLFARGTVMTAEWYDETDWLLAKWGCRRLERGIAEILRLRDEHIAASRRAAQVKVDEWQVAYLADLAQRGLTLDEDGYEIPVRLAA